MGEILKTHLGRTVVLSGEGAADMAADEIKAWGSRKVLVVSDEGLSSTQRMKDFLRELEKAAFEVVLYDKVTSNPKDYEVMGGVSLYKEEKCDTVIGIGGGSSMDAAKCVSAMVRHEGDVMDYGRSTVNRKYFVNGREKLVLVPTTSGTGSEISPHAVITNAKINRKSDLMEALFYSDLIILDTSFVMTMPEKITKDTGIDALTHIIDSYTNKKMLTMYTPFHDALALEGIRLINENLREACKNGSKNARARENMMWAATIGGFVLDLDAGSIHGLAGSLQKYRHEMSHGESVGIMMPVCMEHNLRACPKRFRKIAEAMGVNTEGMTDEEAGRKGIDAIRTLLRDINFKTMGDFAFTQDEIEEFYQTGVSNSCMKNNPVEMSAEEVREVYLETLKAKW